MHLSPISRVIKLSEPLALCLTIKTFTPSDCIVLTVSSSVSPFFSEEFFMSILIELHPSNFEAISNEPRVLVLGSKNKFATVLL